MRPHPRPFQIGVGFKGFPLRSFVSFVVNGFAFPITRSPDHPNFSHSPLPAPFSRRPTPHRTFVENKSPTLIRPSGDRAVEAFFSRFSGLQSRSISALFSGSNCPVGRGSQRRTPQVPSTKYQLPSFQRPSPHSGSSLGGVLESTICSPSWSRKKASAGGATTS
jgi:hypothetical protein